MTLTKDQALIQELRSVILIEADDNNTRAELFDQLAKGAIARPVLDKRLAVMAIFARLRAKMLNEVLAASEPKAEVQQ